MGLWAGCCFWSLRLSSQEHKSQHFLRTDAKQCWWSAASRCWAKTIFFFVFTLRKFSKYWLKKINILCISEAWGGPSLQKNSSLISQKKKKKFCWDTNSNWSTHVNVHSVVTWSQSIHLHSSSYVMDVSMSSFSWHRSTHSCEGVCTCCQRPYVEI